MNAHFSEARVQQDVKQQPEIEPDERSPAAILYERHATPILAYLRLHAPTWEDAEDVLQEVFLATMNHQHMLNQSEQQQLAWLGGIARHKLVDHYRRARRPTMPLEQMPEEAEEAEALTPEALMLGQEQQRELWQAVKHLPALQQHVVYLRFAGGLRSPQIASLLGKREEAVRKALSRAMNQLRSLYQQSERG